MIIIHINGKPLEWSNSFITEDQLRLYLDAPAAPINQTDATGYTQEIHTIADIRFGRTFTAGGET